MNTGTMSISRGNSKAVNFQRWIKVLGSDDPSLEEAVNNAVRSKISSGEFAEKDVNYVASLERPLLPGELAVSAGRLEKLRRLCQLWDVDLKVTEISSHRPVIGPVIVAFKKMLVPLLRALFKDMIRQQRDFNAAAIKLLADLSNDIERMKGRH